MTVLAVLGEENVQLSLVLECELLAVGERSCTNYTSWNRGYFSSFPEVKLAIDEKQRARSSWVNSLVNCAQELQCLAIGNKIAIKILGS